MSSENSQTFSHLYRPVTSIAGLTVDDISEEGENWYAYTIGDGKMNVLVERERDDGKFDYLEMKIGLIPLVANNWIDKIRDGLKEFRENGNKDMRNEEV